ncbi:hypothetical protein [Salinifilum ghardaiensis]
MLTVLAACGGLHGTQQGQNGAPRVDPADMSACARAINVANFMPNFVDPRQARADAHDKLFEINGLLARTSDEQLRKNLEDVRSSVQRVADGEVSLDSSGQWANQQSENYEEVSTTCSRVQEG